ncbi:MAG: NUDIX domain-containing protein [Gammaproteobacteria bacterium]|jgi:ADP-ribose pyrophosphatase YjhB (NUDIX family)|nr:NUDIX domain-containing protein [Gammaproteobacteria bacterium]
MHPTDLTVAAVVEHDNKYLLVEERAMGRRVFSQPGGHIEANESPEQATVREVLEETGCTVECQDMIGVYLWIHPQTRQQFLRIVYAATFIGCDESLPLDDGILSRRWMTQQDLVDRRAVLRSPAVLRCVQDFEAGKRQSDSLLAGMLPLQQNVHRILASADLV